MQLLYLINILGLVTFAISGASSAMEKKLDPFGVVVIAFVTALGGGTVRDVLTGYLPVAWMRDEMTTLVILASAIASFFFSRFFRKLVRTFFFFDALGLGLYTIAGIDRGLQLSFSPGICIALGTIAACFGGVIRDVLLNNVPLIFRREIYASACIAGGLVYLGLLHTSLPKDLVTAFSIGLIFLIRLLAVKYKLTLPTLYRE